VKLTYTEARALAEHVHDGGKLKPEVMAALVAYVKDMQSIGPRGPHTVMPDRGASPRASFGSMKGGSRSWTNR
jgi:hypothetical protein